MPVQDYIESGILEVYVMGAASEAEVKEVLYLKARYPEINRAIQQLEEDLEKVANHMAITPPPGAWNKIEQEIDGLIHLKDNDPDMPKQKNGRANYNDHKAGDSYIEVEASSSYIKVHKNWRWIFAAVFVLGKIFLACAIYFYLENRQAQEQIKGLKTELRHVNSR